MVQILPPAAPKQGKGFLNSLLMGASQTIGPAIEKYQQSQKQAAALKGQGFGEDFSSLPPELQKQLIAQKFAIPKEDPNIALEQKFQRDMQLMQQEYDLKRRNQLDELSGKNVKEQEKKNIENRQKIAPFQAGLETINEMRNLGNKGNLGRGSGIMSMFGGETARDR